MTLELLVGMKFYTEIKWNKTGQGKVALLKGCEASEAPTFPSPPTETDDKISQEDRLNAFSLGSSDSTVDFSQWTAERVWVEAGH